MRTRIDHNADTPLVESASVNMHPRPSRRPTGARRLDRYATKAARAGSTVTPPQGRAYLRLTHRHIGARIFMREVSSVDTADRHTVTDHSPRLIGQLTICTHKLIDKTCKPSAREHRRGSIILPTYIHYSTTRRRNATALNLSLHTAVDQLLEPFFP